jgi:hypothetical protein
VSLAPEAASLSAHVRFPSREAVEEALLRMDVAFGAPVPVWPPRRLPFGIYVSPLRNGWVSLWSPLDDVRDWFPRLTATLECPGVLLEVVESQFWTADFFQDDHSVGRVELPTEAVLYDDLWARTHDSLKAEGLESPREDEARFGARMDELAQSEEYQEAVRQLEEERPAREALAAFLPPHASLEQAWELLWAMDHAGEETEAGDEPPYAEDYLENFASYLGIRDPAWHPSADMETLTEGDYEEEGLPEGWREFHVLPVRHLPML